MADRSPALKQHGGRRASAAEELDAKAIAAKIEHTRREMTATLAAIVDRLSPERLADEAMAAAAKAAEPASDAADDVARAAVKEVDAAARSAVAEAEATVRKLVE